MTQALLLALLFLALVAALPFAVRWLQRRGLGGLPPSLVSSKLISALAVGPQQKVVTVEIGPESARVWLILGVTQSSITCLHQVPAPRDATTLAPEVPSR
ncbi:MAG: flagellar biosynthetic protein FliO [Rhodoferax sp.]|nr:flagellar biosynthetic protein FliO [Rhodoferax sp.]